MFWRKSAASLQGQQQKRAGILLQAVNKAALGLVNLGQLVHWYGL
jgi:hypothetical protein